MGGGGGSWGYDLSYRTFVETLYLGEGPSTGMIVILLRSENCRFWSQSGCLGWRVNVIIIVMQVMLRIPYTAKPERKKKQTNKQTDNAVLQHCVVRKHS